MFHQIEHIEEAL